MERSKFTSIVCLIERQREKKRKRENDISEKRQQSSYELIKCEFVEFIPNNLDMQLSHRLHRDAPCCIKACAFNIDTYVLCMYVSYPGGDIVANFFYWRSEYFPPFYQIVRWMFDIYFIAGDFYDVIIYSFIHMRRLFHWKFNIR